MKLGRLFALCAAAASCPVGIAVIVRGAVAQALKDPCTDRVSRLATETNNLLVQHQAIDRQCSRDTKYYEDMIVLVDKSIGHLEDGIAKKDSDAELAAMYQQRYTGLMCSKTYDAFFSKDPDARMEVLHICIGRKSLAPKSLLKHTAHLDQQVSCPQADSMQARVDTMRAAKVSKAAECRNRKLELKNKLAERRAKEDELEDQYYGHHSNKAQIRADEAAKVERKFCNVIQPNYKLREDNIQAFWTENCPA